MECTLEFLHNVHLQTGIVHSVLSTLRQHSAKRHNILPLSKLYDYEVSECHNHQKVSFYLLGIQEGPPMYIGPRL